MSLRSVGLSAVLIFAIWAASITYLTIGEERERAMLFPDYYFFAERRLLNHTIMKERVKNLDDCELLCYLNDDCVSLNLIKDPVNNHICELNNATHLKYDNDLTTDANFYYRGSKSACDKNSECLNNSTCQSGFTLKGYRCLCYPGFTGEHCEIDIDECKTCLDGRHEYTTCNDRYGSCVCVCKPGYTGDGQVCKDNNGWTLIARFSNSDSNNWMRDDGKWWYDQQIANGVTNNTLENKDMISPAFWSVRGREIKITRSDDLSHTPLLQTTGNCLDGQTFRSKISSYGDFRNGKVWASDQCLGSCTVQYGGQYKSTDGFQQAECSGNIQSADKIGFWCDWDDGDGSVMMIGGGGRSCARADHGIGITETDAASFVEKGGRASEYDFGSNAKKDTAPSQSYSLNLWIR